MTRFLFSLECVEYERSIWGSVWELIQDDRSDPCKTPIEARFYQSVFFGREEKRIKKITPPNIPSQFWHLLFSSSETFVWLVVYYILNRHHITRLYGLKEENWHGLCCGVGRELIQRLWEIMQRHLGEPWFDQLGYQSPLKKVNKRMYFW